MLNGRTKNSVFKLENLLKSSRRLKMTRNIVDIRFMLYDPVLSIEPFFYNEFLYFQEKKNTFSFCKINNKLSSFTSIGTLIYKDFPSKDSKDPT